ncbi:MAG TPA: ABC transporter substrate-binding protein [Methylomirabilota bacterium]
MTRLAAVGLGLGLLGAAIASEAQPARKVHRIGVLEVVPMASNAANLGSFRRGLRELGYVEGQDFAIEYRSADGRAERFPDLARELVRLKVDVIVTRGTPAALAAKHATKMIPIVMASSGDPVGTGIVDSMARPGGNVTGLSALATDIQGKQLEVLREMVPHVARVAFLFNMSNPVLQVQWKEAAPMARSLGLRPQLLDVRTARDLGPAFEVAARERADAVIVGIDALSQAHRGQIIEALAKRRLPAISREREFADAGGLMSYGIHYADSYRRAATYVDKVLKGAEPADLPVEQPTRLELVINLRTARALGLVVPPSMLVRADQIIE